MDACSNNALPSIFMVLKNGVHGPNKSFSRVRLVANLKSRRGQGSIAFYIFYQGVRDNDAFGDQNLTLLSRIPGGIRCPCIDRPM